MEPSRPIELVLTLEARPLHRAPVQCARLRGENCRRRGAEKQSWAQFWRRPPRSASDCWSWSVLEVGASARFLVQGLESEATPLEDVRRLSGPADPDGAATLLQRLRGIRKEAARVGVIPSKARRRSPSLLEEFHSIRGQVQHSANHRAPYLSRLRAPVGAVVGLVSLGALLLRCSRAGAGRAMAGRRFLLLLGSRSITIGRRMMPWLSAVPAGRRPVRGARSAFAARPGPSIRGRRTVALTRCGRGIFRPPALRSARRPDWPAWFQIEGVAGQFCVHDSRPHENERGALLAGRRCVLGFCFWLLSRSSAYRAWRGDRQMTKESQGRRCAGQNESARNPGKSPTSLHLQPNHYNQSA